jgi:hypothetical protein
MPAGRPSDYSAETAESVCALIMEGNSLRDIQDMDGMPSKTTVLRWVHRYPEFRDQYARALEFRSEAHAEEILEIADDGRNDWMERKFGDDVRWVENGEAIRRSQLRIDARKWLMGKHAAKKYGDKITHEGEIKISPIQALLDAIDGRSRTIPSA